MTQKPRLRASGPRNSLAMNQAVTMPAIAARKAQGHSSHAGRKGMHQTSRTVTAPPPAAMLTMKATNHRTVRTLRG